MEESSVFSTVSGLNKEYNTLRDTMLTRMGYPKGARIKFQHAVMMYQYMSEINMWVKRSSIKSDMKDIVTMSEFGKQPSNFKLVAMI
ncbi:hypothetical protein COF68_04955 [Bacillus toyonensis]|uniref:hypothetical protein n=1 Tax=Bacillus toyonensis TaxID=155322 RepID=UPI000BFD8485|nr:hypothetical protein [Bacillus toyonensis]PHE64197.1 hypothetical protein COF68_04955 [Bacillus toyonensis]